jgi:hypothetical protein
MSAPVLHVESDFASPQETLGQYHQRLHPLPPARHLLAFCLLGIGGALSFLLGLFVLYGLAVIG